MFAKSRDRTDALVGSNLEVLMCGTAEQIFKVVMGMSWAIFLPEMT
jgi:hypothetical protein